MDIILIAWIFPYFVDIMHILWILWIYPHFVYILCIGHIMIYLTCNFRPIFHIYSASVSDWSITYFPVCNLIWFFCYLFFFPYSFFSGNKLNPNPIRIYVPLFITSIKPRFYFLLIFIFACFIGVLYYNISQYIHMPDKGWHLSNFDSAFLHLKVGNGAIPLNPCSKCSPSAKKHLYGFCVVCVMYKCVVCVLYSSCCMILSFFNFFLSGFWNWNQNKSHLMRAPSWVFSTLKSNWKNEVPASLSWRLSIESFTTYCISITFFPIFLKIKMLLRKPQGKLKAKRVPFVCVLYGSFYFLCCINELIFFYVLYFCAVFACCIFVLYFRVVFLC